jgi:hypothetical protein
MSPLGNYLITRNAEIPQYLQTPSPFKQYPLAASPLKSHLALKPTATPVQRLSPIAPFPSIKSVLGENDVFAISPAMFPRKTKRVDYLDILADAERTEFLSPIKWNWSQPTERVAPSANDKPPNSSERNNIVHKIVSESTERLDITANEIANEGATFPQQF